MTWIGLMKFILKKNITHEKKTIFKPTKKKKRIFQLKKNTLTQTHWIKINFIFLELQ